MLHTKFQAPEPSGSEERDCLTFFSNSMCFYGSNPKPQACNHFIPGGNI